MAGEPVPFNYRYFIEHAARLGGRSLDYGCGVGDMVALGRAGGLDIWGADTFDGYYSGWADALKPAVRDRVARIVEQRADFPDQHFDLVMSNQVLEHVTDPERVVADVFRLLRPGGRFIAAFPVVDTSGTRAMSAFILRTASRPRVRCVGVISISAIASASGSIAAI